MDLHKIDWSQIPWKEIRKGVEQKAFSGTAATVALHRLQPGHEPKPTAIRTNRSPTSSRAGCSSTSATRRTNSDPAALW
jgi:hypothetical protein